MAIAECIINCRKRRKQITADIIEFNYFLDQYRLHLEYLLRYWLYPIRYNHGCNRY